MWNYYFKKPFSYVGSPIFSLALQLLLKLLLPSPPPKKNHFFQKYLFYILYIYALETEIKPPYIYIFFAFGNPYYSLNWRIQFWWFQRGTSWTYYRDSLQWFRTKWLIIHLQKVEFGKYLKWYPLTLHQLKLTMCILLWCYIGFIVQG